MKNRKDGDAAHSWRTHFNGWARMECPPINTGATPQTNAEGARPVDNRFQYG